MPVLELLTQEKIHTLFWTNIIAGEVFFKALLREDEKSDWRKIKSQLNKWLGAFEVENRRALSRETSYQEKLAQENNYREKMAQWRHAYKLFVCARFVAQRKDEVIKLLEEREIALPVSLNKHLEEYYEQNSEHAVFQSNEIIGLCSIFCKKELPAEIRRVPFVTAPNDPENEGRVHILELRKAEIYGLTMQSPCIFPYLDDYANDIDSNFKQAIQRALTYNAECWEQKKNQLREKIRNLRKPSGEADYELIALEDDLRKMEAMGRIERYGIIWEVKPFLSEGEKFKEAESAAEITKQFEKPEILPHKEGVSGESIGLAATVGIDFTLRDKYPNEQVLYSAKLSSKNNNPTGEFAGVDGIAAKIRAALKTQFIDTFVIHEDNLTEEIKKIIDSTPNKQLRIKTISSEGNIPSV